MALDALAVLVPIILSVFSTILAAVALFFRVRTKAATAPATAAGAMASATAALSEAYERRLAEQEETTEQQAKAIVSLQQRVRELEELERALAQAVRVLGAQVEDAGLTPALAWRDLLSVNHRVGG